jgi:hypothetical protein
MKEGGRSYLSVLILAAGFLIVFVCYNQALGGRYHFDDEANLKGLAEIQTTRDALDFVVSGRAGPLGRPLSLASFVPQAYAWPSSPDIFLKTNIAIHLINGLLAIWVMLRLGRMLDRFPEEKTAQVAVVSGVVWMMLPILTSSSLIIVQRMTLLSSLFVLLGILLYLFGREQLKTKPSPIRWMTFNIILLTFLAALSKENGVLLPVFVLVIEATLLAEVRAALDNRAWIIWRLIFLAIPALLIIGYLISYVPYPEATVLQRGFSAQQRIMTQGVVLWDYLYNAFLPAASSIGPFHDDRAAVAEWNFVAIGALLSWLLLAILSVWTRRRYVLFSFAILWFLAGHLLESTILPLELYFEHRNYLPLIGPVFLVCSTILLAPSGRIKFAVISGFVLYIISLASVLFSVTSLWGDPRLSSELWLMHHPESVRAQLNHIRLLEHEGDRAAAQHVLDKYCAEQESANLCLQALLLSCTNTPGSDHSQRVKDIAAMLDGAEYDNLLADLPEFLHKQIRKGKCEGLDDAGVQRMAEAILRNRRYQLNPIVVHNLNALLAMIALDHGNPQESLERLDSAVSVHMNLTTLEVAVRVAKDMNRPDFINKWMQIALRKRPLNPIRAKGWDNQIDQLQKIASAGPAGT